MIIISAYWASAPGRPKPPAKTHRVMYLVQTRFCKLPVICYGEYHNFEEAWLQTEKKPEMWHA